MRHTHNKPNSIFVTIFCLVVAWFCWRHLHGRNDYYRILGPGIMALTRKVIRPPLSPIYSSYFQFGNRPLTLIETLFYEFDPTLLDDVVKINGSESLEKLKHDEMTLKLTAINTELDSRVKERGDELFSFNLLVSNRIGLFRPLPDTRPIKCPRVDTSDDVPKFQASIVICYYNEAPSALLRTIHSIMKRGDLKLIKEILIVDDFSEHGYDMNSVQPHIKSKIVRFVRTTKREGLIRARLFGANQTSGQVLIFLDSHVEANIGWLDPLMATVQSNKTTIACPMIDLINAETLIYSASPMVKGGLSWALHFKWDSVPSGKLRTYDDFAKPIETPTMAGGLYAIDREYFYELGSYDAGMNLWGGENVEMSLRTWMCGGRIVILPCSRLGHIFRKTRPYGPAQDEPDSLLYNSHRSAQVWLDEYIYKFYEASPEAVNLNTGAVADRILLRQRLNCKNFSWFLDNVYPELKIELTEADTIKEVTSQDSVHKLDEANEYESHNEL